MAVLTIRALHGLPPSYLHGFVQSVRGRTGLRSASTQRRLVVPRIRRSTIGGRSFVVAGAVIWNDLPLDVTSDPTLDVFCSRLRLKLFLFTKSFSGIVI